MLAPSCLSSAHSFKVVSQSLRRMQSLPLHLLLKLLRKTSKSTTISASVSSANTWLVSTSHAISNSRDKLLRQLLSSLHQLVLRNLECMHQQLSTQCLTSRTSSLTPRIPKELTFSLPGRESASSWESNSDPTFQELSPLYSRWLLLTQR